MIEIDLSEHEPVESIDSQRSMWRAVIKQAVVDSISRPIKTIDKVAKIRAIRWLMDCSEDFTTVCELADMNPSFVIQKSDKVLS